MSGKRRDGGRTRLGRKLIAYSAAAGATLALANPAGADIVYSGIRNIAVAPPVGTPVYLDMNGDATNDFTFQANSFSFQHFVMLSPATNNSALKNIPPVSFFKRLATGYAIGSGAAFWSGNMGYLQRANDGGPYEGNFIDQKGFIGVRFQAGSETLNGWIQYEGTGYSNGTIIDWAYETTAGQAIQAGATGTLPDLGKIPAPQAVPTLNQWGLMILAGLILAGGARKVKKLSSKSP